MHGLQNGGAQYSKPIGRDFRLRCQRASARQVKELKRLLEFRRFCLI